MNRLLTLIFHHKISYSIFCCYLGVPSLGLVEIDPLRISTLELDQSNGGPVRIKSTFKDLYIRNVKYVQITKAQWVFLYKDIYVPTINMFYIYSHSIY